MHPLAQRFYTHLSYGNLGTAKTYSHLVDDFLKFLGKDYDKATPMDFTSWYSHLEKDREFKSRRTLRVAAHALKKFYDSMGKYELKGMIPVPSAGEVLEPKWLPEEDCFRLIGKNPVLCVAYDLALRIGEIEKLRVENLNLKTGEIEVTRLKHKDRPNKYNILLDRWCLEIIQNYLERFQIKSGMLFPYSVSTISATFRSRVKFLRLEEGYTFHCLRHSRITHRAIRELEEKGTVDIVSLAKFAGHLRTDTTLMYIHLASKYLAFRKGVKDASK